MSRSPDFSETKVAYSRSADTRLSIVVRAFTTRAVFWRLSSSTETPPAPTRARRFVGKKASCPSSSKINDTVSSPSSSLFRNLAVVRMMAGMPSSAIFDDSRSSRVIRTSAMMTNLTTSAAWSSSLRKVNSTSRAPSSSRKKKRAVVADHQIRQRQQAVHHEVCISVSVSVSASAGGHFQRADEDGRRLESRQAVHGILIVGQHRK
mmetsp:Transcript_28279/g.91179  ORF Transcript_28279/g.91179 Transcript_28279/m.91179 type:complete len:206 (-) Transcript_28279:2221-2838(-)